jgi:TolB-like protein/DNA-binding winged helix-turn-helix (wHTH) protein/Tfp pilus assembly protein PilF
VSTPVRFRFGRFEVDLETGELRRNGSRIHLQERPFQVLAALVARAGELVTREELRQKLWPPDTFVDFDNSLNTAVTKLREALGDTAEDHRFIETLARRGYRFVAPVTAVGTDPEQARSTPESSLDAAAADTPGAAAPESAPSATTARRWVVPAAAALVLGAVAGYTYLSPATAPGPAPGQTRLAVLPFENLTGDSSQDFLCDGFTEETIARLGKLYPSDLAVIARTSSMYYRGTRRRVDEIGRELNVQYVIEGSLRRESDRLRVTAQLIRTSDETHLWADTYDRPADDVLEVQSEFVASIAEAIRSRVSISAIKARSDSPHPLHDPIAYELYLKGRYLWFQRTGPSTRAALDLFQQAVARQPRYALAYAGIADAYIILGSQAQMAMSESHPKARAAALKALEIDETLAAAHTSLAALTADYYWDWPLAGAHFARAVALNPNDVTTHHWYSEYLMRVGRIDEAVREAEAARRTDPLSAIANVNAGYQLARARRYDEALARLEQTQELFPDFGPVHSALGLTLSHRGDTRAALAHFERMREIMGETPDTVGLLGFAQARAGDVARARLALETLDRLAAERHVPAIDRAVIHLGLDERDRAFHWLEQAIAGKEWQAAYLGVDPLYDTLRADPRFDALVRQTGVPR